MSISLWSKIALTKIPSVGPKTARRLVSYCGGIDQIFSKSAKQLRGIPGIGYTIADNISNAHFKKEVDEELRRIESKGVEILCYLDEGYPERLRHFPDSPIVVYKKGNGSLNPSRTVGVVGTRKPTVSGKAICERIISELSHLDLCVLSGLAYGIDITAHRKCLELSIPTFGILGSGLNKVYPFAHRAVAEKMVSQGGIISEFEMDTGPDNVNFPMRNRIIAAMSDALVVIESAETGGSMITADLANSYNKDVFAIPGRPQDKKSQGCNLLIKSNRAMLIESGTDLINAMNWDITFKKKVVQMKLIHDLGETEKKVFEYLEQAGIAGMDAICHDTMFSQSQTMSILLKLELEGLIRSMPGNRFTVI